MKTNRSKQDLSVFKTVKSSHLKVENKDWPNAENRPKQDLLVFQAKSSLLKVEKKIVQMLKKVWMKPNRLKQDLSVFKTVKSSHLNVEGFAKC